MAIEEAEKGGHTCVLGAFREGKRLKNLALPVQNNAKNTLPAIRALLKYCGMEATEADKFVVSDFRKNGVTHARRELNADWSECEKISMHVPQQGSNVRKFYNISVFSYKKTFNIWK